ncbi:MAG TPA: hypothetical protein VMT89_05645, partial [Candidatus Acidoferrales bacterium]|nr:hypothetical protein [Candidatus Acidoferrales bacterium]
DKVLSTLKAHNVGSPAAAESPQVDPLREYSNYLTPQLGLLSADTWALIATLLRNLVLTWLVLIPLFAAVVLLPMIWVDALGLFPCTPYDTCPSQWLLLAVAALGIVVAIAYFQFDLPGSGDRHNEQKWFLWWALLPLVLSAATFTIYKARDPSNGDGWVWGIAAGVAGGLVHVIGYIVGTAAAKLRPKPRPSENDSATTDSPTSDAAPETEALPAAILHSFVKAGWRSVALVGSGAVGGAGVWFLKHQVDGDHTLLATVGVPVLLTLFVLGTTIAVGLLSKVSDDEDREWWARSSAWLLSTAAAWIVVFAAVLYSPRLLDWLGRLKHLVTVSGVASGALSLLSGLSSKASAGRRPDEEQSTGGYVLDLAIEIGAPLFLLFVVIALTQILTSAAVVSDHKLIAALCFAVTAVAASTFVDVNQFSLHSMYRNRLIRAYLGASRPRDGKGCRDPNPFTGFDPHDDFPLAWIDADCSDTQRPFHVINATVNLSKGARLAWQHRRAASFTFTPLFSGSMAIEDVVDDAKEAGTQTVEKNGDRKTQRRTPPRVRGAYRRTSCYGGQWRGKDSGVTLGTALATSGAAVTPNVGYSASPIATLLLSLFNARLGWWLGNPGGTGSSVCRNGGPTFALKPLLSETFGLANDLSTYVLLSDGGHFENLGLYEMVLRRCRHIFVVDAGCDPHYRYDDLGNAVRKIRIDLGIRIEFPNPPSMSRGGGHAVEHFAIGQIHYSDVDGDDAPQGTLTYFKPVITGDEPADVLNYAAAHKETFPHESTGDQWFDEDQFESYRVLGFHSVERFCSRVSKRPEYQDLLASDRKVPAAAAPRDLIKKQTSS